MEDGLPLLPRDSGLFVLIGLSGLLFVVAFLGWFAALATGRMPHGFRNAGAYVLRYSAQTAAYGYLLLTDRYPFSGPAGWREPEQAEVEAEPEPAAA